MDSFGPHFDPSLIGPDGRLTRFHKGGQHKANALQAEANALAKKNAKAQTRAQQTAMKQASAAARQQAAASKAQIAALTKAQQQAAQQLAAMNQTPLETQVIEDEDAIRRARFGRGAMGAGLGVSARDALSRSGLG